MPQNENSISKSFNCNLHSGDSVCFIIVEPDEIEPIDFHRFWWGFRGFFVKNNWNDKQVSQYYEFLLCKFYDFQRHDLSSIRFWKILRLFSSIWSTLLCRKCVQFAALFYIERVIFSSFLLLFGCCYLLCYSVALRWKETQSNCGKNRCTVQSVRHTLLFFETLFSFKKVVSPDQFASTIIHYYYYNWGKIAIFMLSSIL